MQLRNMLPLLGVMAVGLSTLAFTQVAAAAGTDTAGKDAVAAGKALVFDRSKGNCLACHAIAGGTLTGNVGPALNDMKTRYPDTDLLYQRIYDETRYNPMTVMPPFGRTKILSDQDIQQIVAYLLTL